MTKRSSKGDFIILVFLYIIILTFISISLNTKQNEISGLSMFKDVINQFSFNEISNFFKKYFIPGVGRIFGFNLENLGYYRLNINKIGDDSAIVLSEDGKIKCGKICYNHYNLNSKVVLIPVSGNKQFSKWEGPCESYVPRCKSDIGYSTLISANLCKDQVIACELTIKRNTEITAIFDSTSFFVSSTPSGNLPPGSNLNQPQPPPSMQQLPQQPNQQPASIILNAPSNLEITIISNTQLNLVWRDNSQNEKGFIIERRVLTDTFTDFVEYARVNENINRYEDKNLISDTIYEYRIRAYNDVGYSPYSNSASELTCYNDEC